jgi:AcrR family transcriptional regulator
MSVNSGATRAYEMRKRADQMGQTRERIIEATVRLHTTRGPAQTTIAGIASEAGVTRATVYSHFADDLELFAACSGRWLDEHPGPDPSSWAAVEDPDERARTGLGELYAWYAANADALRLMSRDVHAIPDPIVAGRLAGEENMAQQLAAGWGDRGKARRHRLAIARHLVRFPSWESLSGDEMPPEEVADLAAAILRRSVGDT